MVRVAGLVDQRKAGYYRPENKAGLTPTEQLTAITGITHELVEKHDSTYINQLTPLLAKEHVSSFRFQIYPKKILSFLEDHFNEHIFPVLTPLAVDAYRPFPMLLNKSLNLGVGLKEYASPSRIEQFQENLPLFKCLRFSSVILNCQQMIRHEVLSY